MGYTHSNQMFGEIDLMKGPQLYIANLVSESICQHCVEIFQYCGIAFWGPLGGHPPQITVTPRL